MSKEYAFGIGFILGAVFSYSGITGFLGGCALGILVTKYVQSEPDAEWIEIKEPNFKSLFNQIIHRIT